MNRISAKLSIWSEVLSAERISQFLEFKPDHSSIKGSDRDPPRQIPSANGWHLTCRESNKVMAGEVMDALVHRIKPIVEKMGQLNTIDPNVKISFFLHIAPKTSEVSLYINVHSIAVIARLCGDFDIEFFDL